MIVISWLFRFLFESTSPQKGIFRQNSLLNSFNLFSAKDVFMHKLKKVLPDLPWMYDIHVSLFCNICSLLITVLTRVISNVRPPEILLLLLCSPARSLGFTILGEIFAFY